MSDDTATVERLRKTCPCQAWLAQGNSFTGRCQQICCVAAALIEQQARTIAELRARNRKMQFDLAFWEARTDHHKASTMQELQIMREEYLRVLVNQATAQQAARLERARATLGFADRLRQHVRVLGDRSETIRPHAIWTDCDLYDQARAAIDGAKTPAAG